MHICSDEIVQILPAIQQAWYWLAPRVTHLLLSLV